jgi:hypothetical protein
MGVVVGIHQPNFMPWLGYFYKIKQSDIFIFLDDVQFQKTGASYTNRVSININGESAYIAIPIKRKDGTWNINETKFANNKWQKKLIGTFQANYAKAPFFKKNKEFIFELINFSADNIADYNINFITKVSKKLDIDTKFIKSSDFNIKTTSTQRLIDLIKKVDGNTYLSGSGGDNYQDKEMYEKENIKLIYNKMPKITYKQLKTDEFIGGLSIVDAIFNIGFSGLKEEFYGKNSKYSI